jgi:hypothetical protein
LALKSSATAPARSTASPTSKLRLGRAAAWLAAALLLPAGAAAQSSYPIFTLDDFVRMMKSVGANFGGTRTSLEQRDFEEAKSRLTRSREQLAVTITFWRDNKRDDAIKMLRTTLTRMDDLDAALSVETVDSAAAATAAGRVNEACEACHTVYREQDPATKAYRLKPGLIR